jgi:hypothetical protein
MLSILVRASLVGCSFPDGAFDYLSDWVGRMAVCGAVVYLRSESDSIVRNNKTGLWDTWRLGAGVQACIIATFMQVPIFSTGVAFTVMPLRVMHD